jgi:arsenite methyltransferase
MTTSQPPAIDAAPGVDADELARHIVTQRAIATRTAAQRDLWAACIAGASQRDRYLQDIAAAGLELRTIRTNPACRFASDRAQRTSDKYGAHTIELLAVKPTEEISR